MKAIAFFSLLISSLFTAAPQPEIPNEAPPREVCELSGAVYIESVAAFANYRVFVEDSDAFADLLVYKEDTEAFATEAGHWYITDIKGFADFTIYVEEVQGFADFSMSYTDFRTAAGCQ